MAVETVAHDEKALKALLSIGLHHAAFGLLLWYPWVVDNTNAARYTAPGA